MVEARTGFRFPDNADRKVVDELLSVAYGEVDEGKALRHTHKMLRKRGIDPPLDVQYVAEPHVERAGGAFEVHVHADILIYDEFPEMDDCVDTFEEVFEELLFARLEKHVKRWRRRHPTP